jgi:hypothetical protein
VHHAVKELLESSNLNDEQLQIAIRVAHNNLKDRRSNFDEFLREGAHARIIQYSYLHLLFAQMIVITLNTESDHRYTPGRPGRHSETDSIQAHSAPHAREETGLVLGESAGRPTNIEAFGSQACGRFCRQ